MTMEKISSDKQTPTRTILLVDDDADFIELNRQVLESAGYQVISASNRQEALAVLSDRAADLVITDLMMGELNSGFSLAEQIKAQARPPAVIMTTSVSRATGLDFGPRSADDLAKMHVDAYFDKPVRPAALLAKIAELLG